MRFDQVASPKPSWLLLLFFITLTLPVETSVHIGSIRLTPYRLVLLLALVPCFLSLMQGRLGAIQNVDWLIIFHAFWAALALMQQQGFSTKAVEPAGIYIIETLGAYLLARSCIRSAEQMRALARLWFVIVLLLIPFATVEALTGQRIIRDIFGTVLGSVPYDIEEARLGLERAFGPFSHPILYGVFCAGCMGMVHYTLSHGAAGFARFTRIAAVGWAVFLALSSGPFLAYLFQVGCFIWDKALHSFPARWKLLIAGFIAVWIFLTIASNRGPIKLMISYLTLNPHTGYTRLEQWDAGVAALLDHPIFGTLNPGPYLPNWVATIDNFWLNTAYAYGAPGIMALGLAFILAMWRISRLNFDDPLEHLCRKGWLISILALTIAAITVHYWHKNLSLLFFFFGSASWMLVHRAKEAAQGAKDDVVATRQPQRVRAQLTRRDPRSVPGERPRRRSRPAGRMTE